MRAMPSPPPHGPMSLMASRCYCCSSPPSPSPKQRRDAESKQQQQHILQAERGWR
uniref:Uncharacterized protein n=1 Tax=Oryza nivara TaxID=4536 RepID=A0A0E0GTN1_ORYNI